MTKLEKIAEKAANAQSFAELGEALADLAGEVAKLGKSAGKAKLANEATPAEKAATK